MLRDKLRDVFKLCMLNSVQTVSGLEFEDHPLTDVVGSYVSIMPLTGAKTGALILDMEKEPLTTLTSYMTGSDVSEITENLLIDCIGELNNMVCGPAKAELISDGLIFTFKTPFVIRAKDASMFFKNGTDVFGFSFRNDQIEFSLRVILF